MWGAELPGGLVQLVSGPAGSPIRPWAEPSDETPRVTVTHPTASPGKRDLCGAPGCRASRPRVRIREAGFQGRAASAPLGVGWSPGQGVPGDDPRWGHVAATPTAHGETWTPPRPAWAVVTMLTTGRSWVLEGPQGAVMGPEPGDGVPVHPSHAERPRAAEVGARWAPRVEPQSRGLTCRRERARGPRASCLRGSPGGSLVASSGPP